MAWSKRILFKTALTPYTGYGNDGIGLAIALSQGGYDVTLSPTIVQPALPAPVAAMLTRPIEPPYDVLLNHADPSSLGLSEGEQRSAEQRIAWTMWEFTDLGEAFDAPFGPPDRMQTIEERLDTYDTVLVYDEVSRQAIEPRTKAAVKKLQGGYFADNWILPDHLKGSPAYTRDWTGTFRFCMVGMLHARKNPFVAIEAWKILRDKHPDWDVELHLKTNVLGLHPSMEAAYPGLKIHYATWTQQELFQFYYKCHAQLCPSWGEGKHLPAIEGLTTGLPVIATQFGGMAEWMPYVDALSIDYTLEEHAPRMKSARADAHHLAEQMEYAYLHREDMRSRGELGARTVPALMDWSKVVLRLGDLLR